MSDDAQERTEQATPKKQKEAKEQGLVARSREFNSTIVLFCGGLGLFIFGQIMYVQFKTIFQKLYDLNVTQLSNQDLIDILKTCLLQGFYIVLPILLMVFICTALGALVIGGFTFSFSNIAFKFERLDPIKFFTRLFSSQTLIELIKSILKIVLVLGAAFIVYVLFFEQIQSFSVKELYTSLIDSYYVFSMAFMILVASLFIVVLIDVPYQIIQFRNKLMMTKQEIRDEFRETEGKPEVRSKIHRIRRDLAKRRMMSQVPKADVIVTNPTHFAVALKYDQKTMKAPHVVAKGADLVAHNIMDLGRKHSVTVLSVPPLARSLFYFTEIDEEIPSALYIACAQVLAYIHQLKLYRKGKSRKPQLPKKLDIPDEYQK